MKLKDRNKRRVQIARRWAALSAGRTRRTKSVSSDGADVEDEVDGDELDLPDSLLG
jgi:hypothetical protein